MVGPERQKMLITMNAMSCGAAADINKIKITLIDTLNGCFSLLLKMSIFLYLIVLTIRKERMYAITAIDSIGTYDLYIGFSRRQTKDARSPAAAGTGNPLKSPFVFPESAITLNLANLSAPHAEKTNAANHPILPKGERAQM